MSEEEIESIERLKKVVNSQSESDYEIALFDFGEYSKILLNFIQKNLIK